MVTAPQNSQRGWMIAELMIAAAIMAIAMIPLAHSFRSEQKLVRGHYQKVIAMEIIDGEMEVLRAGQWRVFTNGESEFPVTARAATNLPAGKFVVSRSNYFFRLEWRPVKKGQGGMVAREMRMPAD